jgi:hypothetical protein
VRLSGDQACPTRQRNRGAGSPGSSNSTPSQLGHDIPDGVAPGSSIVSSGATVMAEMAVSVASRSSGTDPRGRGGAARSSSASTAPSFSAGWLTVLGTWAMALRGIPG